ncbi:MAG: hypothetical protein LBR44_12655, partial [Clostridiales Family XIII bacterium]|nr:hypothetical protein [Clostridiales Family XIII bacterium]
MDWGSGLDSVLDAQEESIESFLSDLGGSSGYQQNTDVTSSGYADPAVPYDPTTNPKGFQSQTVDTDGAGTTIVASTALDLVGMDEGVADAWWSLANSAWMIADATATLDDLDQFHLDDCTCGQHSWSEKDANGVAVYPKWVQYTGNDANFVNLKGTITHAVAGGKYILFDGTVTTALTYAAGDTIPADFELTDPTKPFNPTTNPYTTVPHFSEAELWIDVNGDGDNAMEQPKIATTQGDGSTVYADDSGYWWLRITGDYASPNPNRVTGRASYYDVDRTGSKNTPTGISKGNPLIGVSTNDQYFYEITSFGADKAWDPTDDEAYTKMLKAINTLKKYDAGTQRWYLDDNQNGSYDAWVRGSSNASPTQAGETWISPVPNTGVTYAADGSDCPIIVGGYDITAELAYIADPQHENEIIPAYLDANGNGQYDLYTEPYMDWNQNGKWDAHYGPELMTGAVVHEWGCPLFGTNVRPTYEGAVA